MDPSVIKDPIKTMRQVEHQKGTETEKLKIILLISLIARIQTENSS
jgi:hypothetical protein